jgi:hypothetical protein
MENDDSLEFWEHDQSLIESTDEWKQNNMEYDMSSCDWLVKKVKESDRYAQNLYAAMCNNEFVQCEDIWNMLKEEYWSVSWRYAGGIIANLRQKGDYMDWYMSNFIDRIEGSVGESYITSEIREDLKKIGWKPVESKPDYDNFQL